MEKPLVVVGMVGRSLTMWSTAMTWRRKQRKSMAWRGRRLKNCCINLKHKTHHWGLRTLMGELKSNTAIVFYFIFENHYCLEIWDFIWILHLFQSVFITWGLTCNCWLDMDNESLHNLQKCTNSISRPTWSIGRPWQPSDLRRQNPGHREVRIQPGRPPASRPCHAFLDAHN